MAKLTTRLLKTQNRSARIFQKGENDGCLPVCGRLWAEGAAAAGAGLLGEFTG